MSHLEPNFVQTLYGFIGAFSWFYYLFIYLYKKKMVKESNHVTSLLGYYYSCYLNPGDH